MKAIYLLMLVGDNDRILEYLYSLKYFELAFIFLLATKSLAHQSASRSQTAATTATEQLLVRLNVKLEFARLCLQHCAPLVPAAERSQQLGEGSPANTPVTGSATVPQLAAASVDERLPASRTVPLFALLAATLLEAIERRVTGIMRNDSAFEALAEPHRCALLRLKQAVDELRLNFLCA